MPMYEKIKRRLTFSPPVLFGSTWVLLFVVFVSDALITNRLNLFLFYVIPIGILTLNRGIRRGLWMCVAAAALWLVAALLAAHAYQHPLILYWNAFMRLLLFFVMSLLIHFWSESSLLARSDGMTGLMNRRFFLDTLEKEAKRSQRYGHPISIAIVDLDNLKSANDTLGHKAGDRMILDLTAVIRGSIRSIDLAARIGGDEFSILLPETDAAGGRVVMERIQDQLSKIAHAKADVVSTASIGLATFAHTTMSTDILMQKADQLMYQAKRAGKNRLRTETFLG